MHERKSNRADYVACIKVKSFSTEQATKFSILDYEKVFARYAYQPPTSNLVFGYYTAPLIVYVFGKLLIPLAAVFV